MWDVVCKYYKMSNSCLVFFVVFSIRVVFKWCSSSVQVVFKWCLIPLCTYKTQAAGLIWGLAGEGALSLRSWVLFLLYRMPSFKDGDGQKYECSLSSLKLLLFVVVGSVLILFLQLNLNICIGDFHLPSCFRLLIYSSTYWRGGFPTGCHLA